MAAANSFGNCTGGIFGCPSCHEQNLLSITEALKLFLPYFPLHIQQMISMYLKMIEFMNTFEMLWNMMNHMEEYQSLFQMFENFGNNAQKSTEQTNPLSALAPFFGNSGFSMPDMDSIKNMMKGSDLVDEFTYVEEPSGTCENGS